VLRCGCGCFSVAWLRAGVIESQHTAAPREVRTVVHHQSALSHSCSCCSYRMSLTKNATAPSPGRCLCCCVLCLQHNKAQAGVSAVGGGVAVAAVAQ
jgi:hypothetical protein